jgi:hypothetical protein
MRIVAMAGTTSEDKRIDAVARSVAAQSGISKAEAQQLVRQWGYHLPTLVREAIAIGRLNRKHRSELLG